MYTYIYIHRYTHIIYIYIRYCLQQPKRNTLYLQCLNPITVRVHWLGVCRLQQCTYVHPMRSLLFGAAFRVMVCCVAESTQCVPSSSFPRARQVLATKEGGGWHDVTCVVVRWIFITQCLDHVCRRGRRRRALPPHWKSSWASAYLGTSTSLCTTSRYNTHRMHIKKMLCEDQAQM